MMTVAVQQDPAADTERLMRRTAMAAVITGGVLVAIKTVAYLMTGWSIVGLRPMKPGGRSASTHDRGPTRRRSARHP